MPWIISAITISYVIGSIPTAYLFARLLKGMDIRKAGSGNVGATNAIRVLGKGAGITVLLLDIFKGALPVICLGNLLAARQTNLAEESVRIILGLACICGHNWTIFLRFKGGKGVATTLGVLVGLAIKLSALKIVLGLVLAVWLATFLIFRIVSIASLISAISLPIFTLIFTRTKVLLLATIILSFFVILRHRPNLQRIVEGKEKRLF
jgi:glycerol-3-phosphate acyltransferase PlsY